MIKTKGGNIENALNFTSVSGTDRQINGLSNTPSQTSSAVNQYYVTSELNKKLDTTTFNNEIVKKPDSSTVTLLNGSQTMTGNLNVGNKRVINSAAPTTGTDLCNKTYVDTELAKKHDVGSVDLSNYLDKTKGGNIEKALNFTSVSGTDRQINGLSNTPSQTSSAVNQYYVISELNKKLDTTTFNNEIVKKPDSSTVMLLNGSQTMTGNLNVGK